jgi:hypothetical protein
VSRRHFLEKTDLGGMDIGYGLPWFRIGIKHDKVDRMAAVQGHTDLRVKF